VLFDSAQRQLSAGGEPSAPGASQAGHPSIPWKAYLVSREFQHVSSDLAEALFAGPCPEPAPAGMRPASLILGGSALAAAGEKVLSGLLAPVLSSGFADSQAPQHTGHPDGLALAA
jgi:hypothetical protein